MQSSNYGFIFKSVRIKDDALKISVFQVFLPFSDLSNLCIDFQCLSKIIYVEINVC